MNDSGRNSMVDRRNDVLVESSIAAGERIRYGRDCDLVVRVLMESVIERKVNDAPLFLQSGTGDSSNALVAQSIAIQGDFRSESIPEIRRRSDRPIEQHGDAVALGVEVKILPRRDGAKGRCTDRKCRAIRDLADRVED